MGGRSSTRSDTSTSQVTETTSTGLQDTEGVAVAGGRDVEVNLQTSDLGAVQGAFDFTQDFSESAFEFASDSQRQAGEISERAIETSQAAVATLATGGQSDIARIDQKTIMVALAALAAILVVPALVRGRA